MRQKDIDVITNVRLYIESKVKGNGRMETALRNQFVSALVLHLPVYSSNSVHDICLYALDIETSTHYTRLKAFRKKCECPDFNKRAEKILEGWYELQRGVRDVQRDGEKICSVEIGANSKDDADETWRANYSAFCEAVGDVAESGNGGNGNQ